MNDIHFNQLVDRYLAGELTDDDRDELCRLLLASAEARKSFWQIAGTHAALREWGKAHWGRVAAERNADPSGGRSRVSKAFHVAGDLFRRRKVATALLTAAAAAFITVWPMPWTANRPRTDRQTTGVAQVTAMDDAVWEGSLQFSEGDWVGSGPLRLLQGCAQLKFASGATVALNGPTDLEVVNGKRIFLRNGRITPFVPSKAKGFTVVSPSGEVVDFGTEFAVGVDASGLTSVYVIDGEVDVATGHSRRQAPLRMTQGFGANLLAPSAPQPDLTQAPIVIDHFDADRSSATAGGRFLRWTDLTAGHPARVDDGGLVIPFADDPSWPEPTVCIRLDNDFTPLVGRRATITYKVTLPPGGTIGVKRWLGLVFDGRPQPDGAGDLPLAWSEDAAAAVMASPVWQAGVRVGGQRLPSRPVFRRDEDASGPYQFVVSLDDSPAGRREHGGTRLDVMVNGIEITTNKIFELGKRPRIGFATYVPRDKGWKGEAMAVVDDFSISVEPERQAERDAGAPR